MPLQSETVTEWESRGWHGFLLDDGCAVWDKCGSCPMPFCTEDVGLSAARREALAHGITPMSRGRFQREGVVKLDSDYSERVYRGLRLGMNQETIACELGIPLRVVSRLCAVAR